MEKLRNRLVNPRPWSAPNKQTETMSVRLRFILREKRRVMVKRGFKKIWTFGAQRRGQARAASAGHRSHQSLRQNVGVRRAEFGKFTRCGDRRGHHGAVAPRIAEPLV